MKETISRGVFVFLAVTISLLATVSALNMQITNLTLYNADTDKPIANLANNYVINYATIGTKNISVVAIGTGSDLKSVVFSYDSTSRYQIESTKPYAIRGDNNGNLNPWTPSVGNHTLKVTPYNKTGGTGTAGTPFSINFSVTEGTQNQFCTDSDNGKNYFIKGATSDSNGTAKEDSCSDSKTLNEYYCSNNLVTVETYTCPYQCSEGRCIDQPSNNTNQTLQQGLNGSYYNNVDFTSLKLNRIDKNISFNWSYNSPHSSINKDTFSVRWTGYVTPLYSQNYTFITYTDDGVRLWVNNIRIINDWKNHSAQEKNGYIVLEAGKPYPITLEYYDNSGTALVFLYWKSNSQPKQIIPSSALSTISNNSSIPINESSPVTLVLVNADTDQDIATLTNEYEINYSTIGTKNINIRADVPLGVESVKFGLDGNANYHTENSPPLMIGGDTGGNYNAWTLSSGTHTVTATPYPQDNAGGTPGTPRIVTFTVTVTEPPATPIGLTALAISNSSILLNWTDVIGESGYKLERSLSSSTGFTEIATLPQNTISYTDNGLSANTYYYRIRAYNIAGDSNYSNVVNATLSNPSTLGPYCKPLQYNSGDNLTNTVNIVFVPSGFNGDLALYESKVREIYGNFSIYQPLKNDIPDLKMFFVTKENGSFCEVGCGVGTPRALCCDLITAKNLSSECTSGYRQTVVLHNSYEHAGAGYRLQDVATSTISSSAPRTVAHELGHSLFYLGDEYTDSGSTPENSPNCDYQGGSKWANMIGYNGVNSISFSCKQGLYYTSELTIMKYLNYNFEEVNMRASCCAYYYQTGGFPAYCPQFNQFSPNNSLIQFCESPDFLKSVGRSPLSNDSLNAPYEYNFVKDERGKWKLDNVSPRKPARYPIPKVDGEGSGIELTAVLDNGNDKVINVDLDDDVEYLSNKSLDEMGGYIKVPRKTFSVIIDQEKGKVKDFRIREKKN